MSEAAPPDGPGSSRPGGGTEIAIVDDDLGVLESFRFMLEVAGYPVATYPSAAQFLASDLSRPRCLVLDQHMPGMSGIELYATLRAQGIALPVMLVSAALTPAIIARARELGITQILEKPPGEEALIGFVAQPCRCPA